MATNRCTSPPTSFPLTAHTITLSVLTYIIDQADRGEFDGILGILEPSEVDELRRISLRDLLRITEQRQPIVRLSVDAKQLRICMSRLRQRHDSEADKLWFVRRGAPHLLMTELFGTTPREFRELRRAAGVSDRGRPAALDPATTALVQEQWRSLASHSSLAARYRTIGERFPELSMASLYSSLHEIQGGRP